MNEPSFSAFCRTFDATNRSDAKLSGYNCNTSALKSHAAVLVSPCVCIVFIDYQPVRHVLRFRGGDFGLFREKCDSAAVYYLRVTQIRPVAIEFPSFVKKWQEKGGAALYKLHKDVFSLLSRDLEALDGAVYDFPAEFADDGRKCKCTAFLKRVDYTSLAVLLSMLSPTRDSGVGREHAAGDLPASAQPNRRLVDCAKELKDNGVSGRALQGTAETKHSRKHGQKARRASGDLDIRVTPQLKFYAEYARGHLGAAQAILTPQSAQRKHVTDATELCAQILRSDYLAARYGVEAFRSIAAACSEAGSPTSQPPQCAAFFAEYAACWYSELSAQAPGLR